ncbi:hypothetical protein MtrunA17_Chr7g0221251 [Medicago truncatula]|uniref:Uncharacterized protein n=1 Tax=Medicago truncatula TaxID=3880 RepID=A0A396GVZ5_MEDTR|nr:hypothetical protein MtrunA17_Chr7g0221251 [Medicago truncatula]
MLKNLTKDLTTAVHSTIPVITNIASSQDSLLQDVSQIISSNTSKIISNTNPLETNNTISSNISKPLTTITNTNPLETIKSISSNILSPLTTITNTTPLETIKSISSNISSPLSTIINTTPLETFNTISSHISSPLITIKNANPLETIKSISSNISSPLTTITNSLVNPLNNLVNPISLATSFLRKVQQLVLGSTQITFPPSCVFVKSHATKQALVDP